MRFIPAFAGNIVCSGLVGAKHSVHPRVRGEHSIERAFGDRQDGSSPRSRGTYFRYPRQRKINRFIPAFAGNIRLPLRAMRNQPVHPRVRGEHIFQLKKPRSGDGSSPRSRGTWYTGGRDQSERRFIPAFAGNISLVNASMRVLQVHPRVRGEHRILNSQDPTHLGSSPRSRGTSVTPTPLAGTARFIPAFAGNMANRYDDRHARPGSSPRSRGT